MLPLKSIIDPRRDSRPERAEAAQRLRREMNEAFTLDEKLRWGGWKEWHDGMEAALSVDGYLNFQCHPALAPTLCGAGGETYLWRIREQIGGENLAFLMRTFRETLCGKPMDMRMFEGTWITRTSMRHVYHLAVLRDFCRNYFGVPVTFVEIGGGFGNLARLAVQFHLVDRYLIVDLPQTGSVQHFYLTEFMDAGEVAIWDGERFLSGSAASKVWIVNPAALRQLTESKTSPMVMISTNALTEMPRPGQDYYLNGVPWDIVYAYGQTQKRDHVGGRHTDKYEALDNTTMFAELCRRAHPVRFVRGDFYSEFLGISHV
jgi:putative sugar O-methyltransferase